MIKLLAVIKIVVFEVDMGDNIFDQCKQIEETCCLIYEALSNLFADTHPEIAKIFGQTAVEESLHANQFTLADRLNINKVKLDPVRVKQTLDLVENIYQHVKKSKLSVADALRSSIKLEKTLNDFHAAYSLFFSDEETKRFFETIALADKEHIRRLEEALESHLQLSRKKLTSYSAVK